MGHRAWRRMMIAGILVLACGCTNANVQEEARRETQPEIQAETVTGDIRLNGKSIQANTEGVVVEGAVVTIISPGTYTLSGTLDNGQVVVDSKGEINLILHNASISNAEGPAIDVRNAGEVTITLAEGTQNSVADGSSYTSTADGQDAAIFSRADLVINGGGALEVRAAYNDGIASRDTLRIEGGVISVHAKNHGIKGKDYLMITGGDVTVDAGGDGIKATNDTQLALGYVECTGGVLRITAGDDGISAITRISIDGGDIMIVTANNGMKSDQSIAIQAGTIAIETQDDDFVCAKKTIAGRADVVVNGRKVTG